MPPIKARRAHARFVRKGPAGLAGMATIVETAYVRLLRPLLRVAPGRLRDILTEAGVAWAEDPSNLDMHALRPRLRALRGDRDGDGPATRHCPKPQPGPVNFGRNRNVKRLPCWAGSPCGQRDLLSSNHPASR